MDIIAGDASMSHLSNDMGAGYERRRTGPSCAALDFESLWATVNRQFFGSSHRPRMAVLGNRPCVL